MQVELNFVFLKNKRKLPIYKSLGIQNMPSANRKK